MEEIVIIIITTTTTIVIISMIIIVTNGKIAERHKKVYEILFKCSQAYLNLKNERQAMIVLERKYLISRDQQK